MIGSRENKGNCDGTKSPTFVVQIGCEQIYYWAVPLVENLEENVLAH